MRLYSVTSWLIVQPRKALGMTQRPANGGRIPETLMFLPGASGNVDLWRPLSDRLEHSGQRRFFGWPGFGPTPPDASIRGLDDLVRLVVKEITQPVTLFAQSMGGVIAVRAALEVPSLVKRLVLSVTSGGVDVAALGGVNWRPTFRRDNPSLPRWFEDDWTDLSDRLPEITAPVLLLWGGCDAISPVAVGRHLAKLFRNSELIVVEDGDHDLASSRADVILPHVLRHLRKAI